MKTKEYKNTITGEKVKVKLSTEKQHFIVRIKTYIFGGADIVKTHNESISQEEIFDEYNKWGTDDDCFIMHSENPKELKVGFGSGALFGGLDKELTFKAVDKKTFEKVKDIKEKRKEIDKIRDKHNFLFGDSNSEMMEKAGKMEYKIKEKLRKLTGWWL